MNALKTGPKASRELRVSVEMLIEMQKDGLINIDPDRFPDEYVPCNPMIARLPCDISAWPGWESEGWNI